MISYLRYLLNTKSMENGLMRVGCDSNKYNYAIKPVTTRRKLRAVKQF